MPDGLGEGVELRVASGSGATYEIAKERRIRAGAALVSGNAGEVE
jgi:hypothetical protein